MKIAIRNSKGEDYVIDSEEDIVVLVFQDDNELKEMAKILSEMPERDGVVRQVGIFPTSKAGVMDELTLGIELTGYNLL